jgi:UDP-GlcNAc:undecaprenyl-phosphate GlcNAc-1-phosphate transferase
MIGMAVAFVVALLVTCWTTPAAIRMALRHGALAVPRSRDVHEVPTPRWGGIAIYAGVMSAVLLTVTYRHFFAHVSDANGWTLRLLGVLIAATFIAAVGIVDDLKDLRALYQAAAILAAGGILLAFGVRIEGMTNPFIPSTVSAYNPARWIALAPGASILATLFWVFLVTKTVDAMDGLDGLAAGVCAISSATLALMAAASHQPEGPTIALVASAVAGACVGFLRDNRHPARVFMSTVGAQFLGLMLAALSIMGTFKIAAAISVLVPVLVLGVPIFDYFVVLAKRAACHAPLTVADRRHFHHRLMDRGLSHRQAVWVIYACTALLCTVALLIFRAMH